MSGPHLADTTCGAGLFNQGRPGTLCSERPTPAKSTRVFWCHDPQPNISTQDSRTFVQDQLAVLLRLLCLPAWAATLAPVNEPLAKGKALPTSGGTKRSVGLKEVDLLSVSHVWTHVGGEFFVIDRKCWVLKLVSVRDQQVAPAAMQAWGWKASGRRATHVLSSNKLGRLLIMRIS